MVERVLVLDSRFYGDIADQLVAGAAAALDAAPEVPRHERISVPGAFELPAALAMAIRSGRYGGFVALGCVIRGETSHYEHVCTACAGGLATLSARHGIALGFGVITAGTRDQAWERASVERRNCGAAAARACLAMMAVRRALATRTRE